MVPTEPSGGRACCHLHRLTLRPARGEAGPPGQTCVPVLYKPGYDLCSVIHCELLSRNLNLETPGYLELYRLRHCHHYHPEPCSGSRLYVTGIVLSALEVIAPSTVTESL